MQPPPSSDDEIAQAWVGEPVRLDGPVTIAEPDPSWADMYWRENARIRRALADQAVIVEHVGSTSVPGLAAKPIIDIVLAVTDSSDEASYVPALEAEGYVLVIREKCWFQHRVFKGPDIDVNLHVFSAGTAEIDRMIAFRDHLRASDADRRLYENAKRSLASQEWMFVQNYADAKTQVITEIMQRTSQ
ncbi:MAG: GrpB family protein [Acidimicrobiia bacterium]